MFGNFQFGRSQFGQPPEAGVTVTVDPLNAVAEIGAFTVTALSVSVGGRPSRPWLPLIPANWPVKQKPPGARGTFIKIGSLNAAANVSEISATGASRAVVSVLQARADIQGVTAFGGCVIRVRPFLCMAEVVVAYSVRVKVRPVLCGASLSTARVRAVRNPTDEELAVILLNV